MRISDWSSDVCSSDLIPHERPYRTPQTHHPRALRRTSAGGGQSGACQWRTCEPRRARQAARNAARRPGDGEGRGRGPRAQHDRSEEHTSELQSLMRISYAVFCLKKKKYKQNKATIYIKQNK